MSDKKPWEEEWQECVGRDVMEEDGEVVACVQPGRLTEDKDATALIVSAPHLYRALEALAALYDTDEECRSLPQYVEAMAALKAARGEE